MTDPHLELVDQGAAFLVLGCLRRTVSGGVISENKRLCDTTEGLGLEGP